MKNLLIGVAWRTLVALAFFVYFPHRDWPIVALITVVLGLASYLVTTGRVMVIKDKTAEGNEDEDD